MTGDVLLPWFVTIPSGALIVAFLASHLAALARVEGMDVTRQRIRQANGIVMLALVPLMTAGLSLVDPTRQPAVWVVIWTIAIFLVLVMIAMAMLDALNTVRIARERRAELRDWLLTRRARADEQGDE